MFIRKVTNSRRHRTLYQVCTTASERGEGVGSTDILFVSESFYDASLVLRFLAGGALSDAQLERYCNIANAITAGNTDHNAE